MRKEENCWKVVQRQLDGQLVSAVVRDDEWKRGYAPHVTVEGRWGSGLLAFKSRFEAILFAHAGQEVWAACGEEERPLPPVRMPPYYTKIWTPECFQLLWQEGRLDSRTQEWWAENDPEEQDINYWPPDTVCFRKLTLLRKIWPEEEVLPDGEG